MPVQSSFNVIVPLRDSGYSALFNMLAGSMDIVDRSVADALSSMRRPKDSGFVRMRGPGKLGSDAGPLAPDVMSYLDARGFLFDSGDEERAQSRVLYDEMLRFHREVAAMPLVVIPSYNCDLKCSYCWQRLYDMDSPIMSEAMAERAFAVMPYVINRAPGQHVDMAVFGGEPLQDNPELRERVLQILELGNRAGFSMKVITNGVGLAASAPHLVGKVGHVQVTIDGPAEVHRLRRPLPKGDSFEAMVRGVDTALEHGIKIKVRVNVDGKNLPTLPELADFARARGWADNPLVKFHLAPVKNHNPRKETNREAELLRSVLALHGRDERMAQFDLSGFAGLKYFDGFKESGLMPLHRFFHCEAQINFLAFDLHGDIYACWDAAGIPELAVGKFHPELVVNEAKLNVWRARSSLDIGGCQGCVSQPTCGGGCQFLALEHSDSFYTSNCDSLLEGYKIAIDAHADWLLERARAGDHAIGLVRADEVATMVTRELGVLDERKDRSAFAVACG